MRPSRAAGLVLLAALLGVCGRASPAAAPPAPAPSSPPSPSSSGPPAAPQDLPFGVSTSYLLGTTLLEQGEAAAALPYLQYAQRLAPDVPEISQALLGALLATGDRQGALDLLDAAIAADPAASLPRRQRIALLTEMERYDDALAGIARAREAAGDDPELLPLEGDALARAGRTDAARDAYRQALTRLPQRREQTYLQLAALLGAADRSDELAALWREAVAALPDSRRIRLGALRDLIRRGRVEDALALAASGDSVQARESEAGTPTEDGGVPWVLEAANLLVESGQVDRAAAVLLGEQKAGRLDRDGTLWLARLLINRNRLPDATRLLRAAATRWPASGRVHMYLGEILTSQGDLPGGESELRQAVSLEPDEPENVLALLRVLNLEAGRRGLTAAQRQERRAELRKLADRGSRLIRDDDDRGRMILGFTLRNLDDLPAAARQFEAASRFPSIRKEALLQLSLCQEDQHQVEATRSTLETLRTENPDDPVVANSLGYFLAEQGTELERAETLVREALAKEPESPFYLDSLGWILHRKGQNEQAFDLLVRAANSRPDDPEILEHMGRTLLALGRRGEAIRTLRRALDTGGDRDTLQALLKKIEEKGSAP